MFVIIRLFTAFFLFWVLFFFTKSFQGLGKFPKYPLLLCTVLILFLLSFFLPIENIFFTFSSPDSSYRYANLSAPDVDLVVSGQDSDLVIGYEKSTGVYLIIPKTADGWKVGIGADTKMVKTIVQEDIVVNVYQYSKSEDYYVIIHCLSEKEHTVTDNYDSHFSYRQEDNLIYTSLQAVKEDYCLNVDGKSIPVFGQ